VNADTDPSVRKSVPSRSVAMSRTRLRLATLEA
jgi:hypothetical protein